MDSVVIDVDREDLPLVDVAESILLQLNSP